MAISQSKKAEVFRALEAKKREIDARKGNPAAAEAAAAKTRDKVISMFPDGAEAETGAGAFDDTDDEVTNTVIETTQDLNEMGEAVTTKNKRDLAKEHENLTPAESAPATPSTVKSKVVNFPVGPEALRRFVEAFTSGRAPADPPEVQEAKQRHAQSKKTDVKPEVERVLYTSNTCESQGKTFNYKIAQQAVDWGSFIEKTCNGSAEDAIEFLTAEVTRLVKRTYGGWNRITEIIVRDQHLIINRSSVQPILDPKTVNVSNFPLDVVDYIRDGAVASFFDWRALKYMSNLRILDVDDMGFYEINIGGRLKCGRRIGVSTIFNYVKSLEVLILAGDEVTRDGLTSDEGVKVKKKLATHKRFTLFSDGFKLNVCQHTNDLSSWTMNNLKNYANNKGDKGLFRYCGGIIARGAVAGVSGILNIGTHLVGGIVNTIKSAMTPVDPEEVGLQ